MEDFDAITPMEMPGFAYSVNTPELCRYMGLSAEQKLRWLKKANQTRRLLPESVLKMQEIFARHRNGNSPEV